MHSFAQYQPVHGAGPERASAKTSRFWGVLGFRVWGFGFGFWVFGVKV